MYLHHTDLSDYVIFDIETNGLTPSIIWCAVAKNVGTKEVTRLIGHTDIRDFLNRNKGKVLVGHNLISFDIPVCNRILGTEAPLSSTVDTLVLSYLYYPRQPGGHSLESWGERLSFSKIPHDDWSRFSPEMLHRCEVDVEITEQLFLKLTKRMKDRGFSERSCKLEHDIRAVIDQQQRNGFAFDIRNAELLLERLRDEQGRLGERISELFPPVLTAIGEYEYRTKRDGTPFAGYLRHLGAYPKVTRGDSTYQVWDYKSFNIGSPDQRLCKLLGLGWKPTKLTKGGGYSTDEEALVGAAEQLSCPEAQAMADWLVLQGRISMLKGNPDHPTKPTRGWIDYFNEETHCIHGQVLSCGTGNRRMTHFSPNTANVPKAKVKVKYGREMRGLWTARPGRVLVGYDARAIEMIMMCHYINNPEVSKLYLEGDPHGRNKEAWDKNPWGYICDRDGPPGSKTGFYAGIYGAQDSRLGDSIVSGGGRRFGTWARTELFRITPGLERLIEDCQNEYYDTNGWITCIDGGLVRCDSPHSALNYKLSSAMAIAMKTATVLLNGYIREEDLDCIKVGDIHDEGQLDVHPKDAERAGQLATRAIEEAGRSLGFNLPLAGSYKIGATWADTH